MPNDNTKELPANQLEIKGDLTSNQPINHPGSLIIYGNVDSGCYIIAGENIEIYGDVIHSKIKSINGNIIVKGGIRGVTTQVNAGKDIETGFVYNSTLKAGHNIKVTEIASDAHLIARNSIYFQVDTGIDNQGIIEGGEIEAGVEIAANFIGNSNKITTIVKLTNFKQMDTYTVLIILDREMEDLKKQVDDLEKFIKVIRLLGKSVVSLPMEKKQDLALKVQKYNDLQQHLLALQDEKDQLISKNNETEELDRTIIARGMVFEGVYAYIDKIKLYIQKNYKNIILYKKGIIIIGDFDEFMKKEKIRIKFNGGN